MIAHLVKDHVRNCKNASDKAVNMALSIKVPTENLTVMSATCSTCARSSSNASVSEQPPKKLKQAIISPHVYKGPTISQDCLHRVQILTYLVANLTCWTTHCMAFIQLLGVKTDLGLVVMQSRATIIAAEVCTATGVKERELAEDVEYWCEVIDDSMFWEGLEHVVSDLEPICYATNIGQRDSTCANLNLVRKWA